MSSLVSPSASQAQTAAGDTSRPTGSLSGVVANAYLLAEPGSGAAVDPHLVCVDRLDTADQIGQTLMPGVAWDRLDTISELIAAGRIGGWVVMGTPDSTLDARIGEVKGLGAIDPLVAVDEEGGRVQRLRNVLTRLPSASQMAATLNPDELRELFTGHARDMVALGFDVDFAPVLDVGGGPGIGDRSYGDEVPVVIEYGLANIAGLEDGGLLSVAKHFPGHGSASADSHEELPTTPPLAELLALDVEPFRHAIEGGVDAIMVGHLDVPGLTDSMPTSLSPEAVSGLLRGDLGFDGLVFTDSLDMGAIVERWSTPEAVELALSAGNDIALLGNADEIDTIHLRLLDALSAGRLDAAQLAASVARILRAKEIFACTL
ncbi:MAG: glycoside hydrolase family 3 protein [Actinomycetia bacterium]|nr:glycoside hydrolase family 3 protein [Actinomycetes bacterium]MCP4958665.1 glycoside hydrolase family 3 protein [Actinomycetes bacterium]